MGDIELELSLVSISDTLKSASDGILEKRTVKFVDTEGKGVSLIFTGNKNDSPFKEWDKAIMLDTGTSILTLTLPKAKQLTIKQTMAPYE